MFKIYLFIIIIIFANYSFCQPSWHIITVDSDGDEGYDTSLCLDSLNRPYIAYIRWYNPPNQKDLKYAVYDGNAWNITVVLNTSWALGMCSLALDSNNIPHISFYGQDGSPYYLRYATLFGSNWQISNVDSQGECTEITVDSLNHPHIAYSDDNWYGLKYAHFDGNTWIIQTVDSQQQSGSGGNNSITTDSQNNPHISYRQDGLGQLRYAHLVSGSWVIEYPDGTATGSYGQSSSICLDDLDHPCISHCNPLRYCSKATGTWQVQQIESGVSFTSLALDSNNYPYIAYHLMSPSSLKLAHWDGSTWQIETVDPTSGAGYYCSLKLDSANRPHIAYQINMAYDLMYAWYGEGGIGVTLTSFATQSTINGIKLCWQATNSGPSQLAGFNLYRVDLTNDPEKNYVKLNQNLITGTSPYSFLDSTAKSGIDYQYRLWALYTNGSREEVGTTEGHSDSIKPATFSLLSVYPNPAKSLLTCRMSLSQAGSVTLSLYDLSGRLVLSKQVELTSGEKEITVGLGKLAKGVYSLSANYDTITVSKKIVIAR